jgi:hypothetical protein
MIPSVRLHLPRRRQPLPPVDKTYAPLTEWFSDEIVWHRPHSPLNPGADEATMLNRILISIVVSFLNLVGAGALASHAVDADSGKAELNVRQRTLAWHEPGVLGGPPYLAGYREIDPIRGQSSVYLGRFPSAAEIAPHWVMVAGTEPVFEAVGTDSDSEFVAVISMPWLPRGGGGHDHDHEQAHEEAARRGTLLISIDGGDPVEVPVDFHPVTKFFIHTGDGMDYSLPQALILDVPDGKHEISIRYERIPSTFALILGAVWGEEEPETKSETSSGDPGG